MRITDRSNLLENGAGNWETKNSQRPMLRLGCLLVLVVAFAAAESVQINLNFQGMFGGMSNADDGGASPIAEEEEPEDYAGGYFPLHFKTHFKQNFSGGRTNVLMRTRALHVMPKIATGIRNVTMDSFVETKTAGVRIPTVVDTTTMKTAGTVA